MSEPTYRDVAQWLPTDIRESIEAALPCRVQGEHRWEYRCINAYAIGRSEPILTFEQWSCSCGLVHTTDPEKRR